MKWISVHFHLITTHFGLQANGKKHGSAELRASFAVFVSLYLDLQAALAGDDAIQAQRVIAGLQVAYAAVAGDMHTDAVLALRDHLQQQLTALSQVSDLQHIREEFYPLSLTITELLGHIDSHQS